MQDTTGDELTGRMLGAFNSMPAEMMAAMRVRIMSSAASIRLRVLRRRKPLASIKTVRLIRICTRV